MLKNKKAMNAIYIGLLCSVSYLAVYFARNAPLPGRYPSYHRHRISIRAFKIRKTNRKTADLPTPPPYASAVGTVVGVVVDTGVPSTVSCVSSGVRSANAPTTVSINALFSNAL